MGDITLTNCSCACHAFITIVHDGPCPTCHEVVGTITFAETRGNE